MGYPQKGMFIKPEFFRSLNQAELQPWLARTVSSTRGLLNISVFYFPEFLKVLLPADSSLQLTTQIGLSVISSLKTKQV